MRNLLLTLCLCLSLSFNVSATELQTATDSATDSLKQRQQHWQQQPDSLETALPLAEAYLEQAHLTENAQFFQQVREVLKPWWEQAEVPAKLRLLRAQWHVQQHHLEKALKDLQRLQSSDLAPVDYHKNLLLQAKIQRMQGHYKQSRALCIDLGRRTSKTLRALCLSSTLSLIGRHEQAYFLLNDMAYDGIATSPRRYQWIRTEMAVLNHRFAQVEKAQENFRLALEQKLPNDYLWRQYGDFLLSQGEAKKLLWELPADSQDAGVQLRRLLAMQALQQDTEDLQQSLMAQFQQAQRQGDQSLLTEEARFQLLVLKDAKAALALAQRAWTIRKAPDLAAIYLHAALAAQQPEAAQDVLAWIDQHQWQDQALVELQAALKDK